MVEIWEIDVVSFSGPCESHSRSILDSCEVWKQARKASNPEATYLYSSISTITRLCDKLQRGKSKTGCDCYGVESLASIETHA